MRIQTGLHTTAEIIKASVVLGTHTSPVVSCDRRAMIGDMLAVPLLCDWPVMEAAAAGVEVRPENANEQPLEKQGPTIPELYSRADAGDPNSSFDHSQFTPQVLTPWHCMRCTPDTGFKQ